MVRCRHNTPKAITMMMALADLCLMMAVVCLCRMLALETLVKAWICIICSLFTLSLKVPDPQHLACSIPPAGDSPETRESLRSFRLKRKACDSNFAYFSDILIFYLQQSKIIGCSLSICSLHFFLVHQAFAVFPVFVSGVASSGSSSAGSQPRLVIEVSKDHVKVNVM